MPNGNMPSPMGAQGIPVPPNALAARGTQPAPNAVGQSPAGFNVIAHTEQNWQQAQAQHKQLLQSRKRMDVALKELGSLRKLGDQIQVEDVIRGAGTMTGAGFAPTALAQMLSQMPTTGGQALEAWVAQQEQTAQQMDAQLQQKIKDSAIHRGITAMASLHVDHIKGQLQKAQGAMPPMPGGVGGALAPQNGMGSDEAPDEGEE